MDEVVVVVVKKVDEPKVVADDSVSSIGDVVDVVDVVVVDKVDELLSIKSESDCGCGCDDGCGWETIGIFASSHHCFRTFNRAG